MPEPANLPVESLRRLAHGLLFERAAAEDVVQDAWVAALESRGEIRGLGAWLNGAVRRLARNRVRADERRAQREQRVARAEAQPSAAEASARIEVLRTLLDAVDRLERPYREAIVLRYFDDLPPREIARRLAVPVNTARTHVRRGLERLRAELDKGPARDREAFLSALVPLLGPSGSHGLPPGARLRRLVMQNKLATAATSLAGLCAVTWVATHAWGADPARERELALASTSQQTPPAAAASKPSNAAQPAGKQDQKTYAGGGREHAEAGWIVRGRATSDGLSGLAGAALVGRVYAGTKKTGAPVLEQHFTADAAGEFAWTLTPPTEPLTVEVANDQAGSGNLPTTSWFLPDDPPPTDWTIDVTVHDALVRGTVRDPDGAPLAGAHVGTTLAGRREVVSGADGTYALPCSSLYPPREVYAWKPGFASVGVDVGPVSANDELVRDLTLANEVRWNGRVLDQDGQPIAGASVWIEDQEVGPPLSSYSETHGPMTMTQSTYRNLGGWPRVLTDASGRYELGGLHASPQTVVLSASAPGFVEASRYYSVLSGLDGLSELAGSDRDMRLVRGASLTGRVLADGAPVAWAWVALGDTEYGKAIETWTDADGRFTLAGVPTGPQYLLAWRRGHAELRHDLVVQANGAPLELVLAASHFLGGVVLAPDGAPRPWAYVHGGDASADGLDGFETYTDAEGRFRLDDLPLSTVKLRVFAKPCAALEQTVALLDRDDLVLHLSAEMAMTRSSASKSTAATAPQPTVTVTAAAGRAHLEGQLLDLSGSGRAGQTILVSAVKSSAGELAWRATTDANGHYAFDALPAGTLRVAWEQHEAGLTALDLEQSVTLSADEFRTLDLQPRGRATLRGKLGIRQAPLPNSVTVGYGSPPPDLLPGGLPEVLAVSVKPKSDSPQPWTQRGVFSHGGHFELEGLEPGTYRVQARIENEKQHFSSSGEVRVPEEGVAEIELSFL